MKYISKEKDFPLMPYYMVFVCRQEYRVDAYSKNNETYPVDTINCIAFDTKLELETWIKANLSKTFKVAHIEPMSWEVTTTVKV